MILRPTEVHESENPVGSLILQVTAPCLIEVFGGIMTSILPPDGMGVMRVVNIDMTAVALTVEGLASTFRVGNGAPINQY